MCIPPSLSLHATMIDLDNVQETYHEVLGPLSVRLTSKHLIQGGFIQMQLAVPSVARKCRIDGIKLVLQQTAVLQSPTKPEERAEETMDFLLWSIAGEGSSPLTLDAESELSIVRQTRIGSGMDGVGGTIYAPNPLRSSTSPHSATGIRMSHCFVLVMHFVPLYVKDAETVEIRVRVPITLHSCQASFDNLQ